MVHVIIAVLPVSSDTVEIINAVQVIDDRLHLSIGVKVGRVRFLDALNMAVLYLFGSVDDTHSDEFICCESLRLFIGHCPERISFRAKVFEAKPYCVLNIFNHVRRPVIEYLDTSELHTGILHIYPAVWDLVIECLNGCFIFKVQLISQNTYCHKISIRQAICYTMDILRGTIPHTGNEVFDGHRGDEDISCNRDALPFRIAALDFSHFAVLDSYTLYAASELDAATHLGDFVRHMLPQLTGSVFRVKE